MLGSIQSSLYNILKILWEMGPVVFWGNMILLILGIWFIYRIFTYTAKGSDTSLNFLEDIPTYTASDIVRGLRDIATPEHPIEVKINVNVTKEEKPDVENLKE